MPGVNGHNPQAFSGSWKNWEAVSGNINGTWRTASDVYVNHNGTWKQVWVRLTGPTNGSTSLNDVTATVSWTSGVGQEGFRIYRSGDGISNLLVGTVGPTATQFTETIPKLYTTYTYTVSAYAGSTETTKISCGAGVSQGIGTPSTFVSIVTDWGYTNNDWNGQQISFNTSCTAVTNTTGYQWSADNGANVAGTNTTRSVGFSMNQDMEYNVRWRAYRIHLGNTYYGSWSNTVNVKAGRPLRRNPSQNFDYNKIVRFDQTVGETPNFTGGFGTIIDSYEFRNVDAVGSSLLANSIRRVTFIKPGNNIVIPYGSSTASGTGDDNGNYRQGPFYNYTDNVFYGIQTFGSWSVSSTPYVSYTLRFTGRSIAQGPINHSIT